MAKPILLLSAPVFNRSGYGDLSTAIARSIIKQDKYDLRLVIQKWGQCQKKHFAEELVNPIDKEIFGKILKEPLQKQPEVFMQITIPNEFLMVRPPTESTPPAYQRVGKFNIGVTAGIETDIATPEFVEGMNRMDLNIVTSKFVKDVFENTKIPVRLQDGTNAVLRSEKPIEVCFWGADTKVFRKTDNHVKTVDDEMDSIPEDFAFLFVGQWTSLSNYNDRKDISNLIKTFTRAFINSEKKPCLILKTNGINFSVIDRFKMLQLIHEIQSEFKDQNVPNVYLMHGEMSELELNALFNHPKVKCHISFTHGEGFGHPLLLQTLSGKPVLVSDWSGHKDFMNERYATLLPGTIDQVPEKARTPWTHPNSKWFNVSYSLAEEKIQNMFNYYPNEKVMKKAESLRLENMEKFSIEAMDTRLWEILDKHIPSFEKMNDFVLPELKPVDGVAAPSIPSNEVK